MNKNLWIGVLTALSAVLFGVIFTVAPEHMTTAPAPPALPVAPRANAPEPLLTPMLSPWDNTRWPSASEGGDSTKRPTDRVESSIKTADVTPAASLEFTSEFADSVRRARAAGIDEVLLAHAAIAQFHRQSEAVLLGGTDSGLDDASRNAARAEAVISLLGESAYRGWQRSDYLLNHNLAGSGITDAELATLMRIQAAREKRQAELWQAGKIDGANYRQQMQLLNEEYRQQILRAFSPQRAAELGLP